MKRILMSVAALSAVVVVSAPAAASAQPWQPINQRQAKLEQRIDRGVRTGDLTRPEAARLRREFRDLARLEAQYRRTGGGLDRLERRDLDQRFDRLSQRIYAERRDGQVRGRY